jgi:hypothetical protein
MIRNAIIDSWLDEVGGAEEEEHGSWKVQVSLWPHILLGTPGPYGPANLEGRQIDAVDRYDDYSRLIVRRVREELLSGRRQRSDMVVLTAPWGMGESILDVNLAAHLADTATPTTPTVLASAWELTTSLCASSVGKQAKILLESIQEWLVFPRTQPEAGNLPELHSRLVEDGSVLFEWVLPQLRLGFGLEEDPSDSGWFLVTGDELGSISASGRIEGADLPRLVSWLLNALSPS